MAQPIKDTLDVNNILSKETKQIIDSVDAHIVQSMSNYSEITLPLFFLESLEADTSMLKNVLMPVLNNVELNNFHEALFNLVRDNEPTTIRGVKSKFPLSQSFRMALLYSTAIKNEMKCDFITSDHILLSLLKHTDINDKLTKLLMGFGLTYEVVKTISTKEHYVTDKLKETIIQIPAQQIINIQPQNNKKQTNGLAYCNEITTKEQIDSFDELIGRQNELMQIYKVFNRRKGNNAILVGKSGVGKTAIVEGMAINIFNKKCPKSIQDSKIFKLNMNDLTSGTHLRGMLETRLNELLDSIKQEKNPILFIDDIHYMMTNKKNEDFDVFNILTNILSNKNLKIIATTTETGYRNTIGDNKQIESKFQKILIDKPTKEETFDIISKSIPKYASHHNVVYTYNAIKACISLSERFITDRVLPLSAMDIIDESGAKMNIDRNDDNVIEIDEDFIKTVISEHTNIPIKKLSTDDKQQLINLPVILKQHIIGQDESVDIITNCIKRNKAGLSNKERPIGSFMAIGNTGCGKTLMAKLLSKELFGNDGKMIRFDMSEYNDKTSVNKLIGSSAGYIGYERGGLLTEQVKNNKYCVLLFDEIEKAAEEVYNVLLQILDEGFLTDNRGEKVDFKNTIIILTSNVGAKRASLEKPLGFNPNVSINKKDIIEKELKKKFPPEFINRLDEVLFFNELNENDLKKIAKLELNKTIDKLKEINFNLIYDDDTINLIIKLIKDNKEYGARPIRKKIETEIENKISDIILTLDQNTNNTFHISTNDDNTTFSILLM